MTPNVVRADRFSAKIPALYRRPGQPWKQGMTHDVSATGVLLEAAEQLFIHSVVEMTMELREPLGPLPAGRLSWVTTVARRCPTTDAGSHLAGLRMLEQHSGGWEVEDRDVGRTPLTFVATPVHRAASRAESTDTTVSVSSAADGRCPLCGSTQFYRVPMRRLERLLSWLDRRRPYHCKGCDRRSRTLPAE